MSDSYSAHVRALIASLPDASITLVGPALPVTEFRWKRFDDGSGDEWSKWHASVGECPACCCFTPKPTVCTTCGGREHNEAGEPQNTYDTNHITFCQGCGEDLLGELVPTEEQEPKAGE